MSDIREQCQHRWASILTSLGVPENLLNKRHQACPFCGGTDRFRWTDHLGTGAYFCSQCGTGDGFTFLMQYTSQDFKDVAADIESIIGKTESKPETPVDANRARDRLRRIWSAAKPLSRNCPTHRYLCYRGLSGLTFSKLESIRCHPGIEYWYSENGDPVKLGIHPAMIALVATPAGEPATLQVLYLTSDGRKAALDPARKIMPPSRPWKGGAVRLQTLEPGQTLCVAEGIETALSMKLLYPDVCPWAVVSAGNMESFIPPNDDSSTVYIAADNDASFTGQAAAFALAKRLSKNHTAHVLVPQKQGHDFLDQLNEQSRVA